TKIWILTLFAHQLHEMRRNTIRQEKILLRNSSSLANNAAFAPISEKKILIST
uniref:Uncharacterized protein n=1 Tax=Aegilops tauschii subsp. strangulata TaxID=200361 RepID=A0A453HNA6_AEGTS